MLAAFAAQVAVAYQQRQLAEAAEAAVPARRGRPDANRAAQRRQPRPAHPDRHRQGAVSSLRSRRRLEPRPIASSCSPAPTTRSTGSPSWSRTCWTCRACRPACCRSFPRPVGLDDVVSRALDHLDVPRRSIEVDVPDRPARGAGRRRPARTGHRQPGRERAALPPADVPVRLAASAHGEVVELRVIDRGPGIPAAEREDVRSRRSSGATTTPAAAARASGSAWPSPAGSPKRCTARSPWTTPRAGG